MLADKSSFLNDLLVVIVLYKKTLAESISFVSLSNVGVSSFFIYDNSPNADLSINSSPTLFYIHDPLNRGVSRAYNLGAQYGNKQNKKWILLCDQDTGFPSDWSSAMQSAIALNPENEVFAPRLYDQGKLISPFKLFFGKGWGLSGLLPGKYSFGDYYLVNSGMVISISLFDNVQGYDERFILDYSDISFICRLKKLNSSFIIISPACSHTFDDHHATASSSRKERFKIFCKAVNLFKIDNQSFVFRPWVILPRALRLSYRHRDSDFLKIGITSLLNG